MKKNIEEGQNLLRKYEHKWSNNIKWRCNTIVNWKNTKADYCKKINTTSTIWYRV